MERATTVGLVTVAYGEKYRQFLPEWTQAVAALERAPDTITLVTDNSLCRHVAAARDLLSSQLIVIEIPEFCGTTPHVLSNQAIRETHTDWICRLDIDDLIYPHALNRLDTWPADVCCFGINVDDERRLLPPHVTASDVLACPHNLLFAGSPFRRDVWECTPGFLDVAYNDWAFWRACAKVGATFYPTGTIDYLYRIHGGSTSSRVIHQEEVAKMLRAEGQ